MLSQVLEADRRLVDLPPVQGADGVEQVRGGDRAPDAAPHAPLGHEVIGQDRQEQVRRDEASAPVDDAETVAVPVGRQPQVQAPGANQTRQRPELRLAAVRADAPEQRVPVVMDRDDRPRRPGEEPSEVGDRRAVPRVAPQAEVRPAIERVRLAIVEAGKSEIAEGIELGELWIEARAVIVATLVADMLIEEGNRGSQPLRQIGPSVGQHPNVAQSIVFRVGIVQGVADDTNQRNLRRRAIAAALHSVQTAKDCK